jgi:hypothetical protein
MRSQNGASSSASSARSVHWPSRRRSGRAERLIGGGKRLRAGVGQGQQCAVVVSAGDQQGVPRRRQDDRIALHRQRRDEIGKEQARRVVPIAPL